MARCVCPDDVESWTDPRLCERCRALQLPGATINVTVNAADPQTAAEAVRVELSRVARRGIGW